MRRSSLLPLLLCACVWTPRSGCSLGGGGANIGFPQRGVSFDSFDSSRFDSGGTCGTVTRWPEAVSDLPPWTEVRLVTDGSDPNADISASVDGTLHREQDGRLLWFEPVPMLTPYNSYSFDTTACGVSDSLRLDIGAYGLPINDPQVALAGRTWRIDLRAAPWADPVGIGEVLALNSAPLLLSVTGTQGAVTARIGEDLPDLSHQDWCRPTRAVEAAVADLPHLTVLADPWALTVSDLTLRLRDARLRTTFAPDGADLWADFSGTLDTRDVDITDALGDLCDLLESFGGRCDACADGEIACITVRFGPVKGEEISGSVEEVPAADCAGCGDQPGTCP